MSISALFNRLGAKLPNVRRSWGSVRDDGTVILRVWRDEFKVLGDNGCFRLTYHSKFTGNESNSGYQTRLEHIQLLEAGAKCYLVNCLAKNVDVMPRAIKEFDDRDLFIGGGLHVDEAGDTWIEMKGRISVFELLNRD